MPALLARLTLADPVPAHTLSCPSQSLLQCPACGLPADVYQTLPFSVLLVDLLLFDKRVYRHLLCNRGSGGAAARERERARSLALVAGVTVALDACQSQAAGLLLCRSTDNASFFLFLPRSTDIRCAHAGPPAFAFASTLACCLLGEQHDPTTRPPLQPLMPYSTETVSLHLCVALSALLAHRLISPRSARPPLHLLPLTLCYTSIPSLFLLATSSIVFVAEYSRQSASEPDLWLWLLNGASLPAFLSSLDGGRVLRLACGGGSWVGARRVEGAVVRGWANEVVLRRAVGGSSAVVGLSGEFCCSLS